MSPAKKVTTKRLTDPLSTEELSRRWQMHPGSLVNWRVKGRGPRFVKIGKRVLYDLVDVEAFEQRSKKRSTA